MSTALLPVIMPTASDHETGRKPREFRAQGYQSTPVRYPSLVARGAGGACGG